MSTEIRTAELDLDAIEARADAASEAPWTAHPDGLVWAPRLGDPVSASTEPEDADFIAAARTDVPALVDEIKRLRAGLIVMTDQRDAARAMADELRDDLRAADESNANLQQHIADVRSGAF